MGSIFFDLFREILKAYGCNWLVIMRAPDRFPYCKIEISDDGMWAYGAENGVKRL
jgi:hypothetical protein